jgi:hypothetical protein
MFVAAQRAMKSGSSFLLAARQCEISELEQLARTSELVGVIGRFIHALQRERGLASIFLSSQGAVYAAQRVQQTEASRAAEQEVRVHFEQLDTDASRVRNGSRLFSRVAVVLHGLESLPALRERISAQALDAAEATAAYVKLVAGLLAVVFEAADAATDPEISRSLVAMFNFMQGKEFAGQERAFGARAFAAGSIGADGQQQWRHLIDAQQGCFQAFADFSDPEILRADQASRDPAVLAEVERLRRIGCTARGPLDLDQTHAWYTCCTQRIDAMREVEDLLAVHLRRLCESRIAETRAELRDQRALLEELSSQPVGTAAPYGPQLERSILAMVQEQSRRLQAMSDELDAVRATLNERKVVERAKGLLMAHRGMSEDEAYKALRQMAMNQNRRLIDVANAVLSLADVLPGGAR